MVPSNMSAGLPGSPGGGFQNDVCLAGVFASCLNCCAAVLPPWRSVQIHSDQVAKPSCSQMSGHMRSVTASPYHMCESSWSSVSSSGEVSNTGLVWVSSE